MKPLTKTLGDGCKHKVQKRKYYSHSNIDIIMKLCPCCKLLTLPDMDLHEICPVCWWEKDDQNETNKYEIFGGPNHDYSLSEAQSNFKKYYIMFRPSDPKFSKLNKEIKIKKEMIRLYQNMLVSDDVRVEKMDKYLKLLKKIDDANLK